MKLSLSVRVAEDECKTKLSIPFRDMTQLAAEMGYTALCMRASAAGVQTPLDELQEFRQDIDDANLTVTMVTTDFKVPLNTPDGPDSLRDISPSLDVAEALGADLIRVCLKSEADIEQAQRAADLAAERDIRLCHQCHTTCMFEEVETSLDVLRKINRDNFGIIYEPANLMLCNQPYGEETLRKFQPYLMNVYLQNLVILPQETPKLILGAQAPGKRR